jgi:23S rRNA (uracil1939-C5)-methyltransferase
MPDEPRSVVGLRQAFRARNSASQSGGTEIIDVAVARLGAAGDGVAFWQGRPVFLPFTVPGDRVWARLGARRGGGHEGRVVDLVAAGPGRATPPCRHFGRCGGCALQHLDRALYRQAKLTGLFRALARAGIVPVAVAPLATVAPARRRARLGLLRPHDPGGAVRVGFRHRFRHDLVDIRDCRVLEPALFTVIGGLRAAAPQFLKPGEAAEAGLTGTDSGIDVLLEASAEPGLAALEALAAFAAESDLARIVWRTPGADILIVERRPVRVRFADVAVPFPAGGFLQASAAAEKRLVAEVVAAIGARRPALDLFAGLGAFTFALAAAGPVHAVEGDAAAAEALARAAGARPGVTVERRDLARDPLPPEALSRYAGAVFDPPRAGAARQAAALAGSALDTVVAVSCNPATFARDAAALIAGGFRLERLVPIDQFVWTPHLELVGAFRR